MIKHRLRVSFEPEDREPGTGTSLGLELPPQRRFDLPEVMMQVRNVVGHEVVERHWMRTRYRLPGNLIQVVLASLAQTDVGSDRLDDSHDVEM